MRRRDAYGGDEELSALFDGDSYEIVELAVGVIMVCLAGAVADLGKGEVHAEGEVWRGQVRLELVDYFAKLGGCIA